MGAREILELAHHSRYGDEPGDRVWRIGPADESGIDLYYSASYGGWKIGQPFGDGEAGWDVSREVARVLLAGLHVRSNL